jgi:hypothetical protein
VHIGLLTIVGYSIGGAYYIGREPNTRIVIITNKITINKITTNGLP